MHVNKNLKKLSPWMSKIRLKTQLNRVEGHFPIAFLGKLQQRQFFQDAGLQPQNVSVIEIIVGDVIGEIVDGLLNRAQGADHLRQRIIGE